MLHIPKDRRRLPVLRLCVLLGLTVLLFLLGAARLLAAAAAQGVAP